MKAKIKISLAVLSVLLLGAILLSGCYVFLEYDPPDPTYVPVQGIYGVPSGGVKGSDLQFKVTVYPANATNQIITWSVKNDGGTGSSIDRNILTPTDYGIVTVTATIAGGGATRAQDYTQDFNIDISSTFFKVTNITNVPLTCAIGVELILPSGTDPGVVRPSNATNKTITWALKNAGGTGAVLTNGNTLLATSEGTVTVTATVQYGKSPSENYTQDFAITVRPPMPIVYVVGSTDFGGCYWEIDTETDTRTPHHIADSRYFTSIVVESGTLYITGCHDPISADNLYLWVIEAGKEPERHLIENDAYPSDYNSIVVSNGKVYIAGGVNNSGDYEPVYWEWDTTTKAITDRVELWYSEDETWYSTYASGIAVNGSTVYVSGKSDLYGKAIACYWTGAGESNYHELSGDPTFPDYYGGFGASGIAFVDTNRYIIGQEGDYWLNGTYHPGYTYDANDDEWTYIGLPIPTQNYSNPYSITVRDSKWYVAGSYYDDNDNWDHACYWENGAYKPLGGNGSSNAYAITVQQGNVYAAGCYSSDTDRPCYWAADGTRQPLPIGTATSGYAYGIAVGWR